MSEASTPPIQRLIVVDDDKDMAALIAKAAGFAGYETQVASAEELLDFYSENEVDVIVIDLFMPDTDGYELIQALAERGCTAAIILISGYDVVFLNAAGKIAKSKRLNLHAMLTKPLIIDEFQSLLENIKIDRGISATS